MTPATLCHSPNNKCDVVHRLNLRLGVMLLNLPISLFQTHLYQMVVAGYLDVAHRIAQSDSPKTSQTVQDLPSTCSTYLPIHLVVLVLEKPVSNTQPNPRTEHPKLKTAQHMQTALYYLVMTIHLIGVLS